MGMMRVGGTSGSEAFLVCPPNSRIFWVSVSGRMIARRGSDRQNRKRVSSIYLVAAAIELGGD